MLKAVLSPPLLISDLLFSSISNFARGPYEPPPAPHHHTKILSLKFCFHKYYLLFMFQPSVIVLRQPLEHFQLSELQALTFPEDDLTSGSFLLTPEDSYTAVALASMYGSCKDEETLTAPSGEYFDDGYETVFSARSYECKTDPVLGDHRNDSNDFDNGRI